MYHFHTSTNCKYMAVGGYFPNFGSKTSRKNVVASQCHTRHATFILFIPCLSTTLLFFAHLPPACLSCFCFTLTHILYYHPPTLSVITHPCYFFLLVIYVFYILHVYNKDYVRCYLACYVGCNEFKA